MRDAYIFDAVRTPRGLGKKKGSLYEVSPIDLLVTVFKDIYQRNFRLSHLCKAVGITGDLENPEQLLGKRVKLRVIPYYRTYLGKRYLNHKITRFHPADQT